MNNENKQVVDKYTQKAIATINPIIVESNNHEKPTEYLITAMVGTLAELYKQADESLKLLLDQLNKNIKLGEAMIDGEDE